MHNSKFFTALLVTAMLVFAIPIAVMAAPIEITASLQSSLDKMMAATDHAKADKIGALYNEFLALQQQEQDWDDKIKAIHTGNGETFTALGKQMKQIDADKIDKLEADVVQTKERYKPLFAQYSSLNKQIAVARKLKDKDLSSLLRAEAGTLKIPVQLARLDIKKKEKVWQEAKDSAAKTIKEIRGTLTDIDPVNVQIKAKQSAVRTIETGVTPVWNTFKQAVKKGESQSVLDALASLVSIFRQINEEKEKVFTLETKIEDILSMAKAQLP